MPKRVIENMLPGLAIGLNTLLALLIIFYEHVTVPPWLQVFGRMHPLVLHFPIVLVILAAGWSLAQKRLPKPLLLVTALITALAALMGVFLSREPGYQPEALQWHKYSGVILSFLMLAWYFFHGSWRPIVSIVVILLVIITGHQGAGITHGDGFLLAPVRKSMQAERPPLEEAMVYADMVQPILREKCMSCHNDGKAKGDLSMETLRQLVHGGKSGDVFKVFLARIHLPSEEKKHMPPAGKPQLEPDELGILLQWLKHNPSHDIHILDLPAKDTLRLLANNIFREPAEAYDFSPADEKDIAKLNTNYRVITPLAQGSPALAVDFYGPGFFQSQQLKELEPVRRQVVSLNLYNMPATDADLELLRPLSNLRVLNLAGTRITSLGSLAGNVNLRHLSVSNTSIKPADLRAIAGLKGLRSIFAWNTAITDADKPAIARLYPRLRIETGARTDTMHPQLNAPLLRNEELVVDEPVDLKLKHFVPGTIIHYTLNGAEPDSAQSPIYAGNVKISGMALVKARAFKPGWLSSETLEYQFYHSSFHPDTVILQRPPDSMFLNRSSKLLYDRDKGDMNVYSPKWIGFRGQPLSCMIKFATPVTPGRISLSSVVDRAGFILPPASIEIYGGNSPHDLKSLGRLTPVQPDTSLSRKLVLYECDLAPATVRYLRVDTKLVPKMPDKLINRKARPKDNLPWFFIDEIFIN